MPQASGLASPSEVSIPLLRELTLADHEASTALEGANGLRARSRDEWERQWVGNPAYDPTQPMGWVLEDEETGRMVGTLSNIPLAYTFRGRAIRAVTGRGWAVDPASRPFAALLFAEYFAQDADLMLSTTVNNNAEASHSLVEQGRAPVGDWSRAAYRITNYSGFAGVALRLKGLPTVFSGLVGAGLWSKDMFTAPRLPEAGPSTVCVFEDFDERFDRFWDQLRERKNELLLGVRSRAVLRWHFGGSNRGLRVLTVSDAAGHMSGYAVLVRADRMGLTRYRVADVQCLDDSVAPALARKAVEICEAEGIHALEVVGCGLPPMREFERVCGYRRELPAWCYFYMAPDEELMQQLADPVVWEPSSFDGDSSI